MAIDIKKFYSMQLKKQDIQAIFQKLKLEVRTTDHIYGWLVVDGKKILRVHYSFGKGNIPAKVTDKIRGQLKLDRENFINLVKCPLSRDGYIEIIKEKGYC
ncbi:MAG: hypothetical protein MUF15_12420 [Acidobacteria bacterium]|jgi:hypothetical protein|nr:hypothetical protein [Acidobacteriota bacterium]